jgi:hypothetical protein
MSEWNRMEANNTKSTRSRDYGLRMPGALHRPLKGPERDGGLLPYAKLTEDDIQDVFDVYQA